MANPPSKLHIAVFPWLAFGHMIPFLELSKLIAQKGHKVSFISTPRNIDRLPKIPKSLSPIIDLVKLPLPAENDLPKAAEATSDLSLHQFPLLKKAYDGLQASLASFLETSAPDWIIYDFAPHWLPPLAAELGISRAIFFIFAAWSVCTSGPSAPDRMAGNDPRKSPEDFTVPPKWVTFPTKVTFRLFEARRFLFHRATNYSDIHDTYRTGATISGCEVLAVKNCYGVGDEWLRLLGELHEKPVAPVGLLLPSEESQEEEINENFKKISNWLDKQRKESVLYVAFGSEASLRKEELNEMAFGLERSGVPFFWALRKQNVDLPTGFEERVADRGVVWMSWAPQFRILQHESVGGFLTHCGLSSIAEGLNFGRALVMLPLELDQGLNARVFAEKMVGVEIPRKEEDGSFESESVAESIRLVMAAEEGKIYRENAKEMMKIVSDRGRQEKCIDNFLECLETIRPMRKE